MRSDLQIEASRANGSSPHSSKSVRPYPHGTEAAGSAGGPGPVSEEGKLASSRNALKHGILSDIVLLPGEDPESFEADAVDLFEEHKPVGHTEQELVEMMIVARWRRTRNWMMEKTCMAGQLMREYHKAQEPKPSLTTAAALAFVTMADNSRTLDLLNRYESRYDRQYFRAHRRLLETQDRRMRNEPDNTPPPAPAPGAPITPSVSAGNSSDFAKGTQADPENVENKEPDTEATAATIPAPPVARRSFYLTTVPAAIFDPVPPENPAVFHAGTAASHP